MFNIRYRLSENVTRLKFADLVNGKLVNQPDLVYFQQGFNYFVDILETEPDRNDGQGQVKMKIYMPDGRVHIGWQSSFWLVIHHTGNPYDGRFNAEIKDKVH
jgi:hypothetical protein